MTRLRDRIEKWFNDNRVVRLVVAVVLIAIALIGVSVAIKKTLTRELDLYVVLNASRNLLAGADIYTTPATNGAYYLYLPLLALVFIPLALLPQTVAGVMWTLACIALIAWSLHESGKLIAGDEYAQLRPFERWAINIVPVILCADAISSEIGNAQVNCLVLAAAVLALKLADSRRDSACGTILGVAAVAKVFSVPLVLFEFLNKRFRLVLFTLAGGFTALLLPALLIGWQRNVDYITYWTTNIALYGDVASHRSGFAGNASIQAVLLRLFTDQPAFAWNGGDYHLNFATLDPSTITDIGAVIPFLALGVLVVYFLLFRRRTALIFYWGGIALAFCTAPLITPIVERPHFALLLPAYVYVT
ncbi:MAG TPA: glycosyltransferase family 87 protein, partial [Pyrinomonadaceae bacterium]